MEDRVEAPPSMFVKYSRRRLRPPAGTCLWSRTIAERSGDDKAQPNDIECVAVVLIEVAFFFSLWKEGGPVLGIDMSGCLTRTYQLTCHMRPVHVARFQGLNEIAR